MHYMMRHVTSRFNEKPSSDRLSTVLLAKKLASQVAT